jgi:hypothetical protein
MTRRRNTIRSTGIIAGLVFGAMAVGLASYAVSAVSPLQQLASAAVEGGNTAGHSVHAKNKETPAWILELQTRNARQLPVPIHSGEPSFWI